MFDNRFFTTALASSCVCWALQTPAILRAQDESESNAGEHPVASVEEEVAELEQEIGELRERLGTLLGERRERLQLREDVEARRQRVSEAIRDARRRREQRRPRDMADARVEHVRQAIANLMEAGWHDEAQRLYRRLERPGGAHAPNQNTESPDDAFLKQPLPPHQAGHVPWAIEQLRRSLRHIEERVANSEELADAARQANMHVEELRRQFDTHSRGLEEQLREQLRLFDRHAAAQVEELRQHVGRMATDVSQRLEQFEREQEQLRNELNHQRDDDDDDDEDDDDDDDDDDEDDEDEDDEDSEDSD